MEVKMEIEERFDGECRRRDVFIIANWRSQT